MNKISRKNIKNKKNRSKKYRLKKLRGGSNNATGTTGTTGTIAPSVSSLVRQFEPVKNNTITNRSDFVRSAGTAKELLDVCVMACDIMKPMIQDFYNIMNVNLMNKKPDDSVFTVVDGLVQHFLKDVLFKDKFAGIVGEENVDVNITTLPYTVDQIALPNINTNIDNIKTLIDNLRIKLKDYKDKYVFIDPIDGTKEFSTGKGQQSTICIGFSSVNNGLPYAGIVYRPIDRTNDATYIYNYIYGCAKENLYMHFPEDKQIVSIAKNALLTSNSDTSKFLAAIVNPDIGKFTKVPSGGAGNKMLMLLEGKGEAYIQDRGLSRWDTCAAQAVIEAAGGVCCKLTDFLSKGETNSYAYKLSEVNTDFDPNSTNKPSLNLYNLANKKLNDEIEEKKNKIKNKKEEKKANTKVKLMATNFATTQKFKNTNKYNTSVSNSLTKKQKNNKKLDDEFTSFTTQIFKELNSNPENYKIENFKTYSNLCGIVAFLDPTKKEDYLKLCKDSEKVSPPSYD